MFYNENERILNFCFLEKHADLFQVVTFRIKDYLHLKRRKCLAKFCTAYLKYPNLVRIKK